MLMNKRNPIAISECQFWLHVPQHRFRSFKQFTLFSVIVITIVDTVTDVLQFLMNEFKKSSGFTFRVTNR